MDAKGFSTAVDFILVYSRQPGWVSNKTVVVPTEADSPFTDGDGRRYSRRSLQHGGKNSLRSDRPGLWYPITAPDGSQAWPIRPDGTEGRWRWGPDTVAANTDRIEWVARNGGMQPYVKTYSDAGKKPLPPLTLWLSDECGSNASGKAEVKALFPGETPFSTPKPERLLERIIHIATNPGDLVVDAFAGSGTTAAVAHKMGRAWAAVEVSASTADAFVVPRLSKVVAGTDPGGVTAATGWNGGGGFLIHQVAPAPIPVHVQEAPQAAVKHAPEPVPKVSEHPPEHAPTHPPEHPPEHPHEHPAEHPAEHPHEHPAEHPLVYPSAQPAGKTGTPNIRAPHETRHAHPTEKIVTITAVHAAAGQCPSRVRAWSGCAGVPLSRNPARE
jgi:hypothetical protein